MFRSNIQGLAPYILQFRKYSEHEEARNDAGSGVVYPNCEANTGLLPGRPRHHRSFHRWRYPFRSHVADGEGIFRAGKKRRKARATRDPEAPKPPSSAFMVYSNFRRGQMKQTGASKDLPNLCRAPREREGQVAGPRVDRDARRREGCRRFFLTS